MDLGLTGRTVNVTGASGGIGRHITHGFAAEGADVVLTYHRAQADAERFAKKIDEHALAAHYAMDDPTAGDLVNITSTGPAASTSSSTTPPAGTPR